MSGTTAKEDGQQWLQYIKNRIALAHEWRKELDTHKSLAEACRYIRIRNKDFRAISISSDNPCGHLVRKDSNKQITERTSIGAAIKSILNAEPFGSPKEFKPEVSKTEHKIQAFIIRYSLMNELNFCDLFPDLAEEFDDLLFITDELSSGKLRADVIALGGKEDQYFPVFIELKASRLLTKLADQLKGAQTLSTVAEAEFVQFLSAVSGVAEDQISLKDYRLMLIWPASQSGNEHKSVAEAREKILTVQYRQKGDEYVFERAR